MHVQSIYSSINVQEVPQMIELDIESRGLFLHFTCILINVFVWHLIGTTLSIYFVGRYVASS